MTPPCPATSRSGSHCQRPEHRLVPYAHVWETEDDWSAEASLGKLQAAVRMFLRGKADQDHLARVLDETGGGR